MNIHEYQAKQLLKQYGVNVAEGRVAFTPEEAVKGAEELGGPIYVVKAQIHAGGRGKAGGVKVVKTIEEVKTEATRLLGSTLVTHQTGPEGKEVQRLYIEDGCDIARELYLSFVLDRASGRISIVYSTEGGMDIEEVAESTPEKVHTIIIDPATGLTDEQCDKIASALGLEDQAADAKSFLHSMYKFYTEKDADMIEINPLVVMEGGGLRALDAKVSFDGNALFRHPDIVELRDITEEDPSEKEAADHELSYVKMDGNIGCMVNGAGLAMSTMDIIKLYGAEPANFLDVGGGATKERVSTAFKLILSDPNVEGILVNIFGGIMRCDVIAEGVIAAAKELDVHVPLVVRLEGTNVEQGKELLNNSGLDIVSADNLDDAAKKIVEEVKKRKVA